MHKAFYNLGWKKREWIGPSPCETATTIEMNQEHWSPHQKSDHVLWHTMILRMNSTKRK